MAANAPVVLQSLAELLAGEPDPVDVLREDQTLAMA